LPNGEKAFHVIEVQSDWGQEHRRQQEYAKENGPGDAPISSIDHPLLPHYETLGLKAAIQHAKEIGATKVILPDAETAMMTEGHDRVPGQHVVIDKDGQENRFNHRFEAEQYAKDNGLTVAEYPEPPQSKGMRLHYDQTLPSAMRKLTGDSGQYVDLGTHKNASWQTGGGFGEGDTQRFTGSPVFKDAAGNPKTNITGRVYDISRTPDDFTMTKAGYSRGTSVVRRGYGPTHMYNT
jgi:hypothetical protein